jgi:hypothetical protein
MSEEEVLAAIVGALRKILATQSPSTEKTRPKMKE